MSVPDRNHLAIGEVLSLLQAEFPDVTISKIRFLESQGLIDPERTPSGYRKFYDDDIARLRWILAQQRDHFLPLKVIKDRLEEAVARQLPLDVAPGPGSSEAEPELVAEVPLVASAGARDDALATGGRGPRINVFTAIATSRPDVAADAGAVTVGEDEPVAEAPAGSEGSSGRTLAGSAGADGDRPVGDPSDDSGAAVTSGEDAPHADLLQADHRPAAAADGMTAPDAGDSPEPAVRVDSGAAAAAHDPAPSAAPGRVRRRAPAGAHPFGDLTSASFTIEELSAAVGLPVSDLEELERYGLLTSRAVSQGRRYGDDAVVVAKLAQRFAAFGVQARHLRMFKVAVDREIALYEQIVAPLARHRHEGGEVAAAQRWADLDQLGADLRDALFRRPLS